MLTITGAFSFSVVIFLLVEGLKYCENYQNVTQRHEVSKYCWKNGASGLARHRVASDLQFVQNAVSAKYNKRGSACNQSR